MKKLLQMIAVLGLVAAVVGLIDGRVAFAQTDDPARTPASGGKAPVQGYTRMNKHTGQPEQVRAHKRRPPAPKPVEVQSYTRDGQTVTGHQRRPPAKGKPKSQSSLPRRDGPGRWLA